MQNEKPLSFEDTSIAFSSKTNEDLEKMHFLFSTMNWKYPTKIGTFFIKTALKFKLPVQSVIKKTLFTQFCGGETIGECKNTIADLMKFNVRTILDYSVEGLDSDENFDNTMDKVLESIEAASSSSAIAAGVFKMSGIGPAHILEKIQNGEILTGDESMALDNTKRRAEIICRMAYEKGVSVFIDAEESWIQGTIDAMVFDLMKLYNREKAIVFNTFQMYRADMPYNLEKAFELASSAQFFLGIKLVRGAYMDKERKMAAMKNYESPIFSSKQETDEAYDEALQFCAKNINKISICAGTHNEKSNYLLPYLMLKHEIEKNDPRVSFAQLYGMSDHISYNLAAAGYNVAKYLPFGPIDTVLPYLFRRAEENRAVTGTSARELQLIKKEIKRRKKSKIV
ncbi:MAG TPA: proline dehydrogenase family protein [Cytophagaceae bacterium]|jgi:proline dehydrogenase|nr:proline dehydrogenase family protein [Cytophagaceae bacterium]